MWRWGSFRRIFVCQERRRRLRGWWKSIVIAIATVIEMWWHVYATWILYLSLHLQSSCSTLICILLTLSLTGGWSLMISSKTSEVYLPDLLVEGCFNSLTKNWCSSTLSKTSGIWDQYFIYFKNLLKCLIKFKMLCAYSHKFFSFSWLEVSVYMHWLQLGSVRKAISVYCTLTCVKLADL